VTELVYRELLAARKRADGLSSASITSCHTLVDLIGDGDPLIAMTRLTHRILETIERDDDAIRITAAAYSLGLGSAGRTHLQRLTDFGEEYGYEARQARRLSDDGVRELAQLITTNWIVHAVPTVEVLVIQQRDESFAIQVSTRRQWYIDMHPLLIQTQDSSGERSELTPPPLLAEQEAPKEQMPRQFVATLENFIRLPAPEPEEARYLRLTWVGEIWPRFIVSVMGPTSGATLVTSQCVGNTLLLTLQRDQPRPSQRSIGPLAGGSRR
jgi:hypothetical protein